MEYTKGKIGRILIVRFDHGDDLLESIKRLVQEERINFASITFFGALESGDIVTGPKKAELPPLPEWIRFDDGREVLGFGTIVMSENTIHSHFHVTLGKGHVLLPDV
ncbi:MAG: DUF296 domain-containing protein [Candidatus Omnitrophota bacterium]